MTYIKLSRKRKKQYKKDAGVLYKPSREDWEWFYFKRRVEIRCMYTILGCQDAGEIDKKTGKWITYDIPKQNYVDDDVLLEWYKKHYPNDKEAQMYCKQNRNKWI
jgi:hypothetical protein